MEASELRLMGRAIVQQFRNPSVTDEEIIRQIKEQPELINAELQSKENLFLSAVRWNRFHIAQALEEMGADINWRCEASLIAGNALNVAHSPEQADYLLEHGVEIEKNLSYASPYRNPAIAAADHNDKAMLFYWLNKQKEIFAEDEQFVKELIYATMETVALVNQYDMLSNIIADEELYEVLKEVYSRKDNEKSIKLILSALSYIKDEELESKKKELRKILNTRKKELKENL